VPIPNIRKLQDRGVNFVNFYCNVPICAPSRTTLMLGQHMGHTTIRGSDGRGPQRHPDAALLGSQG
jgi:arylsulfatase A-like enzyme